MRQFFGWLGDDGEPEENFRSYGMIDDRCSGANGWLVGWLIGWLVGWLRLLVYFVQDFFFWIF